MAIMVTCGGCGAQLRVRDEYLGRSMKCPRCDQVIQTDATVDAVPAQGGTAIEQPRLSLPPSDDDVPVVLPTQPRDRQHQREALRRAPRESGEFAPCPRCGSRHAERVLWTVWGSFYGPALLTHVRCLGCGNRYNGRTGRSNVLAATAFVLIPLLLIVGIIGGLFVWLWQRSERM